MKAEAIRELNEKCQAKALETETPAGHDAALVSLELSLLAELTAQVAEGNETRATLRDQFAMAALQALVESRNLTVQLICERSYLYADAMLKARNK